MTDLYEIIRLREFLNIPNNAVLGIDGYMYQVEYGMFGEKHIKSHKATEIEKAAFNLFEAIEKDHKEKIKQSELQELERLKNKYENGKSK